MMYRSLTQFRVKVRPFTKEFLKHCAARWNLVAFTASNRAYAESMLDHIDPDGQTIRNILSREHCNAFGMRFVKDFRMIETTANQASNMLMLDNKLISFGFNLWNGIPMLPFTGDPEDNQLKCIVPVLDHLSQPAVSIASFISSRYKYDELISCNIK